MNLLLIEPAEIAGGDPTGGGKVRLVDRRAEHLRKVLRVEPGKTLRAGVVGGGLAEATVVAVAPGAVDLELGSLAPSPAAGSLELAVGLPRPQGLHRVLQTVAAMGVRRLHLVNAWRVEKSYFSSPSLAPETVRRHLLLGAEQGMTTRLPEVEIHPRFLPFVAATAERGLPRLLAHPGAEPVERAREAVADPLLVAIGPEGGWIDREVETFVAAGFRPVALGPWVLRVEVAVVAVLAQLEVLRRLAEAPPAAPGRASVAAEPRPR